MSALAQLHGPLFVTLGYFALWYTFLFGLQTRTKYRLKARYASEGEIFDRYFGRDPEMLAADRVVANTHEQMGPFLSSLWLCAGFGSPTTATALGTAYVVLRAIYPVLLGRRVANVQSKRVALVTFPCYGIVFTMFGLAAWGALGG